MIETVKNVASVVGCIISSITLCGIIIKPIRKVFVRLIKDTVGDSEMSTEIKKINEQLEEMIKGINLKFEDMNNKIDALNEKVEKIDARVFENERDRIKAELSNYAARCRRGIPLYPEEFIHIQEIYDKYSQELHCNHSGTEDYNYIRKYYESQDFSKLK